MSDLTFDNRLARSRACAICDFILVSSVRCCVRISLCRARLVDFSADCEGSESKSRESCPNKVERYNVSADWKDRSNMPTF